MSTGNRLPAIADIVRENLSESQEKLLERIKEYYPEYTMKSLTAMVYYVKKKQPGKEIGEALAVKKRAARKQKKKASPVPRKPVATEPGADISKQLETVKATFVQVTQLMKETFLLIDVMEKKIARLKPLEDAVKKFYGPVQ